MTNKPLEYYIDRYIDGTISKEEWQVLRTLLDQPEYARLLDKLIDRQLIEANQEVYDLPAVTERVIRALQPVLNNKQKKPLIVPYRTRFLRRWSWAAAVAVLVLIAGTFFWIHRSANQDVVREQPTTDISPGSNKAILTLSDGSKVTLDSTGNQMIRQGPTVVQQQGGQLTYNAHTGRTALSYNTLTTPRGGQFRITLPDGTRAWLNAASSIRYPTAFNDKDRTVAITGEIYFEVAKDARRPFRVTSDKQTVIEVLGTSFNVNAYTDEPFVNTTLVDGSVLVRTGDKSVQLSPGEAARTVAGEKISIEQHANIAAVTAWKNGLFNFYGADLQTIMKQLSRWYDVDIIYTGSIPQRKFWGEMQRTLHLSEILEVLKESNIHFRIEGKTLIVAP
ncbi:FecR domain-containing protein [Chitinophaga defluvii]|uniref:FecR domain-containing protein n=1 Tax=Chitinophaga defluvii TaxID=3163343 RepID=A0ABV2TDH2_9BACT